MDATEYYQFGGEKNKSRQDYEGKGNNIGTQGVGREYGNKK